MRAYEDRWKRCIDVLLVLATAVLWVPIFTIAAVAVRLSMGQPVLFVQERPGRDGQVFGLFKIRTMSDVRNQDGSLAEDEQRLTRLGRLLRSSSIDEIPEFVNVLRGEMSLVGPRPLLCRYLPLYSSRHARRHSVRPGITGWAQINGRNLLSWNERFEHDLWYIDNMSLWLDLKILVLTLKRVVARTGVSAPEHATMPEFRGNDDK